MVQHPDIRPTSAPSQIQTMLATIRLHDILGRILREMYAPYHHMLHFCPADYPGPLSTWPQKAAYLMLWGDLST